MSILDDLLALDEEEDRRIADELAIASSKPAPVIRVIEDDDWLIKDVSQSNKKATKAPTQRETKLKRVLMAKLVWAKCHFFKGASPYFPGRIADPSEAACQRDIPTTIDRNLELIEFFCLPKNDPVVPQYVLVPKTEVRPFDSALGRSRQLSFTQACARGKLGNDDGAHNLQWDTDSYEDMRQVMSGSSTSSHLCQCSKRLRYEI